MGKKRCKAKDYRPLGEELFICKNCKRQASQKSMLCNAKKVHEFLEKEKSKQKKEKGKKKKLKKKDKKKKKK